MIYSEYPALNETTVDSQNLALAPPCLPAIVAGSKPLVKQSYITHY
jgi:hypothetical protein